MALSHSQSHFLIEKKSVKNLAIHRQMDGKIRLDMGLNVKCYTDEKCQSDIGCKLLPILLSCS